MPFMALLQYAVSAGVALLFALMVMIGGAPAAQAPADELPAQIPTPQAAAATTTLVVATSSAPTTASAPPTPTPTPVPAAPTPTPKPAATATPQELPTKPTDLPLPDVISSITTLAASSTPSVNERVRAALVNILCSTAASGPFDSTSASGVIIDPRGVILTNAHAAQFFLLKDYPVKDFVQCIIRTGSPASPSYTAELLFISPSWVAKNAEKIDDESPTGNGEHDYALLRITGTVSPTVPYPQAFPFVLTSTGAVPQGTDVLVAGYAAGFLGTISVIKDLYASSAFSKIGAVYSYNGQTADLFSVGGTVVAQQGSSGGAVTTTDGTLVGLIVTSTQAEQTSLRDLRALATSYVIRDFESERGKSLQSVLSGDLATEAATFNQLYTPLLTQKLVRVLEP